MTNLFDLSQRREPRMDINNFIWNHGPLPMICPLHPHNQPRPSCWLSTPPTNHPYIFGNLPRGKFSPTHSPLPREVFNSREVVTPRDFPPRPGNPPNAFTLGFFLGLVS